MPFTLDLDQQEQTIHAIHKPEIHVTGNSKPDNALTTTPIRVTDLFIKLFPVLWGLYIKGSTSLSPHETRFSPPAC